MAALARQSGSTRVAEEAVATGGPRSSASASGCRCSSTGRDEDPDVAGLGVAARAGSGCLPDGVKRPQMQWNQLDLVGPAHPLLAGYPTPGVGLLRPLVRRGRPTPTSSRPATTAVRSWPRSTRGPVWATQFHPEKSGAVGLRDARPTSWQRRRRSSDGALPGDRPHGAVAASASGRATTTTRRVYGDDPVAVARRFAGAGARWIHVVDLDAARTRRPGQPSGHRRHRGGGRAAGACACRPAAVSGDEDAARALWDVGVARVVLGTRRGRGPGAGRTRWPRVRPGRCRGRPRRPRRRGGRPGLGRGQRPPHRGCARRGSAMPAWPRWSSPTSTATACWQGPDLAGLGAVLDRDRRSRSSRRGGVGACADLRRPGRVAGPVGRGAWPGRSSARRCTKGRLTVEEGVAACAASA